VLALMKKVLIVEDHADMRELLTWQVELMGFTPYRRSTAKRESRRPSRKNPI